MEFDGRDIKKVKGCEAFFPGEFTQQFPDGSIPRPCIITGSECNIPISRLSHGTHEWQASEIRPNEEHPEKFNFKVYPRLAKQPPKGQTFQHVGANKFKEVPINTPVLPGKYTWWGVSVEQWYASRSQESERFLELQQLKSDSIYVAEYLQTNPPACPYGDTVFTVDLKDLLKCYVSSRTDVDDDAQKKVKFLFAGTLRYRYEICYVIIVAMVKDDTELGNFRSLHGAMDRFNHNGLIAANGELEDTSVTPTFAAKHTIKFAQGYESWETPAFAFYFPNDGKQYQFNIPEDVVEELPKVSHRCSLKCNN